jgi:enoyl-CoA hydratase/carnithine racemase
MELTDLIYETRNQAAWITLNRPRLLNALSAEMLAGLRRAYEAAGDDRNVRAVVITGAGRGFCAGADIHVMDNASLESFRAFLLSFTQLCSLIRDFPKPTIAAINGVAVGVVSSSPWSAIFESRAFRNSRLARGQYNQPMTNGSTYLLPRLIGEGRAKLLGMSGEIIDAAQAERIGLVSSVVEDQGLTAAVEELVAKLVSVGPIAVACVKECFARSRDVDIEAAVIFENEAATKCFVSADQQEGLRAFLEKRKPRWSGR